MIAGLQWYWWVLIAVVVVAGGYLKLKLFKKMTSKKDTPIEDEDM